MMHRHAEDEAAAKARYKKMKADVIKTDTLAPGIFTMVGRGIYHAAVAVTEGAVAVVTAPVRAVGWVWRKLFG